MAVQQRAHPRCEQRDAQCSQRAAREQRSLLRLRHQRRRQRDQLERLLASEPHRPAGRGARHHEPHLDHHHDARRSRAVGRPSRHFARRHRLRPHRHHRGQRHHHARHHADRTGHVLFLVESFLARRRRRPPALLHQRLRAGGHLRRSGLDFPQLDHSQRREPDRGFPLPEKQHRQGRPRHGLGGPGALRAEQHADRALLRHPTDPSHRGRAGGRHLQRSGRRLHAAQLPMAAQRRAAHQRHRHRRRHDHQPHPDRRGGVRGGKLFRARHEQRGGHAQRAGLTHRHHRALHHERAGGPLRRRGLERRLQRRRARPGPAHLPVDARRHELDQRREIQRRHHVQSHHPQRAGGGPRHLLRHRQQRRRHGQQPARRGHPHRLERGAQRGAGEQREHLARSERDRTRHD